jgi:chromosome segregation ATPase
MNSLEYNSIIDTINKYEFLKHDLENKSEYINTLKNVNKLLEDENEQARIYSEKLYEDIIKLNMEIDKKDKKLSESINALEKDNELLQDEIFNTKIFVEKLYDDIIKFTTEIENKNKKLSEKSESINVLENDNKLLQYENEQARIYSEKLYEDIINLKMEIDKKDKKLSEQSESINAIENDNKLLQDEIFHIKIFVEKLYDDIMKFTTEIENKDKKLSEDSNHIKELQNKLQNEIEDKEGSINMLENVIQNKDYTINSLQIKLENKEVLIKDFETVIQNTEYAINTLQNNIEKNERYIKELEIVIKCYQKYSNTTRPDENTITDFSKSRPSRFGKGYEIIIVNNILKAKTNEFLWTDITNPSSTPVFDLYKNFNDVIKHLSESYICTPHNPHNFHKLVEKKLTNMQKLKDDEYFIGVYYGNIHVSTYLMATNDNYSYNLIFCTNYGNIIDFSFSKSAPACGPVILDIKYYYNYKKLDITFINHLNLIIAKRETNTQSFIDITSQELNNIILSLYGIISHSVINSIPITKTNKGIGWREREKINEESSSLVTHVLTRRKSVKELSQEVNL